MTPQRRLPFWFNQFPTQLPSPAWLTMMLETEDVTKPQKIDRSSENSRPKLSPGQNQMRIRSP